MKTCTKCGDSKPLTEFYKDKRGKDGRYAACRACHYKRCTTWWDRNRPAMREKLQKRKKRDRAKFTALQVKRYAAGMRRTPPWLTKAHLAEIEGAYHFARVMEAIAGEKYHVDHIEPLQGKDVSGLHVPWNLRVIPARENFAKGNRRMALHG